jgi:hypothetical protein
MADPTTIATPTAFGVYRHFGWLPPDLSSRIADCLTPSRRNVADTLCAPVDAASYWLHRLASLNVPTTTPSSSTHSYQPAANVPFSSQFLATYWAMQASHLPSLVRAATVDPRTPQPLPRHESACHGKSHTIGLLGPA